MGTVGDNEHQRGDSGTRGKASCLVGTAGGILGLFVGGACGLLRDQAERGGGVHEMGDLPILLEYVFIGSLIVRFTEVR